MIPPDERRKTPRSPAVKKLAIKVLPTSADDQADDRQVHCSSVDISAGGLRLLVDAMVGQGERVQLSWTDHEPEYPLVLEGEVRWIKAAGETGLFWIGVELTKTPPESWQTWFELLQQV